MHIAFQKIGKNTRGRLEILTSIYILIGPNEMLVPYILYTEYSHDNLWDDRYHVKHCNLTYLNFVENVSKLRGEVHILNKMA